MQMKRQDRSAVSTSQQGILLAFQWFEAFRCCVIKFCRRLSAVFPEGSQRNTILFLYCGFLSLSVAVICVTAAVAGVPQRRVFGPNCVFEVNWIMRQSIMVWFSAQMASRLSGPCPKKNPSHRSDDDFNWSICQMDRRMNGLNRKKS